MSADPHGMTLAVICKYIADNGHPPRLSTLATLRKMAVSYMGDHMKYLERHGYIKRTGLRWHQIEITEKGKAEMSGYDFGTQLYTYRMIVAYVKAKGYPPAVHELAKLRGLQPNAIYEHLNELEARGYIVRLNGWRNIRLPRKDAA